MSIVNADAKSLEWISYLFISQDKVGIEEWLAFCDNPKLNDIHTKNQKDLNLVSRLIAKIFLFRCIYRGPAFAYSMDPDFANVSKSPKFWQGIIDKFFDKSIWGFDCLYSTLRCGVAWNTLFLATLVGVATTLLGLAFALVIGETLYFKVDAENGPAFDARALPCFSYTTKTGRTTVMSYARAPEEVFDDPDVFAEWARGAVAAARRAAAAKPPARRKTKAPRRAAAAPEA